MKKKVAIYIGSLGTGGIESCTISQFLHMNKTVMLFDFIVDKEPSHNNYYYTIINNHGNVKALLNSSKQHYFKLSKFIALYKLVKTNGYDIFHLHLSYPTSLLYLLIIKFAKPSCKTFVTSHAQGTSINSLKTRFSNCIARLILPIFSDYRFADSDLAGRWMFGKFRFKTIINGIDITLYKFNISQRLLVRKELGIDKHDFLIGHVGRFEIDKNHAFIFDLFEQYIANDTHTKLLLIGNGSLHQTFEKRCKDKSIDDKVIFILNTPEVYKYLSAMDLFIFPSFREGFGLVAIEAQAASLPVLASSSVPMETKQTDIIYYEDLNSNIISWCKIIDTIRDLHINREEVNLTHLYENCDINNISDQLGKLYCK